MPTDPVTCLECHQHLATCRGLCPGCHSTLGKLVRVGGATWAQLEAAGRCRPALGTPWRKWHDREANR
jgi:hypothetical protein